jgi:hypothetical protein
MVSALAELSVSAVTIPHGVPMGPDQISPGRLVRTALGCPRQFKSVANQPPTQGAVTCIRHRLV